MLIGLPDIKQLAGSVPRILIWFQYWVKLVLYILKTVPTLKDDMKKMKGVKGKVYAFA